jgi:hypothetical protein
LSRGGGHSTELGRRAFSLVEILVVMGLLTVIILGLMAMFHQTQRAFRLGMTQTDVLESGRIVTDMMVRELEQMTPSGLNGANFNSGNFYSALINGGSPPFATPAVYTPFLQPLPGGNGQRMNLLDDVFFIIRQNQTWTGIGYFVRSNDNFAGVWSPVGTLYRFETNATVMDFPYSASASSFFYGFKTAAVPSPIVPSGVRVSKILDGVIHFRVRAYDINGNWINPNPEYFNSNVSTNILGKYTLASSLNPSLEANYFFYSNAVPAFVELELGILEQQTLERYRSIPVYTEQTNFLAHQAAHVHLFRQRIAIRNLDPSAYQ